ncbi:Cytochrome oxidase maturation protein cbb3-type [Rubripirellula lacrimiformis]|uniref:Cytochrome oxidase maturation protein cbb3-type n=1 Tax=Rubripirellula lacrimiformis TaxID=1930273 RepID=A0A517N9M9_9BACT|nr:cbb3-type cytochrome oxidase assembly protein CcoS [Rubripirellula lacrimiformis]QDT03839.1 Cytochrome oxidase maturation protein cbb3-type [Rubripirellula lacrimiformis]
MSVIYIALPIAIALGAAGLIACVYCIRGGQYDDMDTPAMRMLIDDRSLPDDDRDKADRSPADHSPADHSPADHSPADHSPADDQAAS